MLMRTDPFRDLDRLTQQVFGTAARPALMAMDAWREGDTFTVEFDLPGIDTDSIDLDVERNVLTVRADRPAREGIAELVAARRDDVRLVILFLGSVPNIDLAGAEMIAELHRTLAARGITLRLAEAHGQVRDALGRIGFEGAHGALESAQTVDVILAEWEPAVVSSSSSF